MKHDLRRLHAERQAYEIRRQELKSTMHNTKGMSLICICAMGCCFGMLLLFQFGLHMDSSVGYLLTGLVMAGVLVYVYVSFDLVHVFQIRSDSAVLPVDIRERRSGIR